MKNIISEDMLRLYVRNQVRKTLQEQGKITFGFLGQWEFSTRFPIVL